MITEVTFNPRDHRFWLIFVTPGFAQTLFALLVSRSRKGLSRLLRGANYDLWGMPPVALQATPNWLLPLYLLQLSWDQPLR